MKKFMIAAAALALIATPALADPPPGINADLSVATVQGVSGIAGQTGAAVQTGVGGGAGIAGGFQTSSVVNGANAFATPNNVGGSSFASGANLNLNGGFSAGQSVTQTVGTTAFQGLQGFEAFGADFHLDD